MTKMDWARHERMAPQRGHSLTAAAVSFRPRPSTSRTATEAATSRAWKCPLHHSSRYVEAGISKRGRPYPAFYSCMHRGCDLTSSTTKGR